MNDDSVSRDRLFRRRIDPVPSFQFNEEVASVFDDMAVRSIPYYEEVQRLTVELAAAFTRRSSRVYDLGCSTGTTLVALRQMLAEQRAQDVQIIGVDSSPAMRDQAFAKLTNSEPCLPPSPPEVIVQCEDLLDIVIESASVVVMSYTLQFVPPLRRHELLSRIFTGLQPGGTLLVSDKTLQSSTDVSRLFMDIYYDLKRTKGYSEIEIAQKRESLDNVLVPYGFEEEKALLLHAGFSSVDVFFSWCNFTSFICVKNGLP